MVYSVLSCKTICLQDTVVYDPFYHRVPEFFDLSFSELLEAKHPEMWLLFERGQVDEASFLQNFFADGRPFDHLGFVNMMVVLRPMALQKA